MTTIYDLHDEIFSVILIVLVTSSNGAADLVRLSSTCRRFFNLARQSFVLKVVNFEKISIEDYEKHQHVNDLLCLCARAGNLAAESRLGKAILCSDDFFLGITLKHDAPLSAQNADTNGVLIRHKLVRSFIRQASEAEFVTKLMCGRLIIYINSELGHDASFAGRTSSAISEKSVYYWQKYLQCVVFAKNVSLGTVNSTMPQLKPETGVLLREILLAAFDEMFPLIES